MASTANHDLNEFLERHKPVFILTGAGLSAASGLGTYRNDDGEWSRQQPITGQDFRTREEARKRYWTRSYVGWPSVEKAEPNRAHYSLVELEKRGWVAQLVTQNVDGLHTRAGQRNTIDLHGNLHRVICLSCDHSFSRLHMQSLLLELNPMLKSLAGQDAPDGDSDVDWRRSSQVHDGELRVKPQFPVDDNQLDREMINRLKIPPCPCCNGVLKPDVVFFGENVDKVVVNACFSSLAQAGSLLVAGSSLMVYSGYRFAKRASELNLPIAIVNRGKTRADSLATLRLHADCSDALQFAIDS